MGRKKLRRGGKNTEENYTKMVLKHLHNYNDVVTHLEPDILECEVNGLQKHYYKVSRGNGIPAEIFKILKDDVKVLHLICQQIWKLSSGRGTGKGQFSFQSQRRTMPKNIQATIQSHSFFMLVRLRSVSFRLALSI